MLAHNSISPADRHSCIYALTTNSYRPIKIQGFDFALYKHESQTALDQSKCQIFTVLYKCESQTPLCQSKCNIFTAHCNV